MLELTAETLRLECRALECRTSSDLAPLEGIIGQDRALQALKFGLGIGEKGFNLYAAGPPGTGKTTAVRIFLEVTAKELQTPPDWCYVNNFRNPYEPVCLKLPAGRAVIFRRDVRNFIEEVKRALPRALRSDEFQSKRDRLVKGSEERRNKILADLGKDAERSGFSLQASKLGIILVPIHEGKPVSEEELAALPDQVKKDLEKKRKKIELSFEEAMKQLATLETETRESLLKLTYDTVHYAIGFLIRRLLKRYEDIPEAVRYLNDVRMDILESSELFLGKQDSEAQAQLLAPWMKDLPFRRYEVNLIVNNSQLKGAPVIFEENPTYHNLFGRIEKEAQFGSFTTDFTLIKGGSLHRANGGYLVLPVQDLLENLFAYDALKRALRNDAIMIEDARDRKSVV